MSGCDTCGGLGFVRADVPFGHPDFGKAIPCTCAVRRAAEAVAGKYWNEVPQHYQEFDINSFPRSDEGKSDAFQAACAFLREYPADYSLFFTGAPGTGKTGLGLSIIKSLRKRGACVVYVNVPQMFEELRKGFNEDNGAGYDRRFETLQTVELLMLDDIGVPRYTEWGLEKIYILIDARFRAHRTCIFTSDLPADKFRDKLGYRISSRILEYCRVVTVGGVDLRARGQSRWEKRKK